ncbi:MAG: GDP-mannose 4,6-dehydratase [Candidatus Helarchaeota archaeon]
MSNRLKEIKKKLRKDGYLIDPENLEPYMSRFKGIKFKNLTKPSFWEESRVFITGISGFVGSHLTDKLLELGAKVAGLVRRHSVPEYPNIKHVMENNTIITFEGDLKYLDPIITAFRNFEPEYVFHLGAQSFVPTSIRNPIETYETNIIGTSNVLEACRILDSLVDIKAIQIACSSEQYGRVYIDELPIKETNPMRPLSPYAASKQACENIALSHYEYYGIPVRITRGFNHTGSRRGLQFVTSVVTRQIARVKNSDNKKVIIGNPAPVRDFTDVRDMMQGYLLSVEKGKNGDIVNLGHGAGISIGDLVKLSAKVANLKEDEYELIIDESRYRKADVEVLICDYSKAKKVLGYYPQLPIIESIKDSLDYFEKNPRLMLMERH